MQIELVKLPIKFADVTQEESERNKSLFGEDWTPELTDGFKYFNVNHICDFNEDSDGMTTLCMSNRDIKIYMEFEKFKKLSIFKILE